jgi:hypothetical protein
MMRTLDIVFLEAVESADVAAVAIAAGSQIKLKVTYSTVLQLLQLLLLQQQYSILYSR